MRMACSAVHLQRAGVAAAVPHAWRARSAARHFVRQAGHLPAHNMTCLAARGCLQHRRQRVAARAAPPEQEDTKNSSNAPDEQQSETPRSDSTSSADAGPKGLPPLPSRIKPLQASPDKDKDKSSRKGKKGDDIKFEAPHFPARPRQSRLTSLEQALGFLVATGGVYGTLAVSLAWLAHIEPFGNFHYDRQDILTAVLIFIPVYLTDALILVPEWETEGGAAKLIRDLPVSPVFRPEPPLTDSPSKPSSDIPDATASKAPTTSMPLDPPSSVPASSWGVSPLQDQIQPDWGFLDAIRIALQRTQDSYFQLSFGTILPEYLEVIVILVGVLGQEMLYRGVVFTLLAGWLRDRYYEAGADDLMQITSSLTMTTEDVGRWSALGVFAAAGAASVGRKMWEASRRNRVLIIPVTGKGKDVVDVASGTGTGGKNQQQRFLQVGPRISQTMALTQLIKGGRDVLESMAACTSFLLTHNLAATYAATVLSELLFSLMQRQGIKRYRRKSNRYYKKLSQALYKARKNMEAQQGSTDGSPPDKSAFASTDLPTKATTADPAADSSDTSPSSDRPGRDGMSSPNGSSQESSSRSDAVVDATLDTGAMTSMSSRTMTKHPAETSTSSSSVTSHPLSDGLGCNHDSASASTSSRSSSNGVLGDSVDPITPIDEMESSRVAGCSSVLPNAPRLEQGESSQNGGTGTEQQDFKRLADGLAGSLKHEEEEETAVKPNAR